MKPKTDDLSGMKILLVDDVIFNIEILLHTLKLRDYQISVANSGAKALELVPKIQPDLILLDIMMPEMDGIEVCRRLKDDESTRDIPIIFVTAKTGAEDVVEGFKVGGVDYISKPFRLEEVLARVETHLRLRKTLRDKDDLISELRDT
ncbi:MAG: response regulator, partial [Nitrospina sp.]|nr:response regulator [Nitrospina sp.]